MKTYHATIKMSGGFISKLQSDTLFGGLCWALRYSSGESVLREMLAECIAGRPPFVVSDLFPADLLPKPFLPPRSISGETLKKAEMVTAAKQAKRLKETKWLSFGEFQAIAAGEAVVPTEKKPQDKTVLTLHNTISRETNHTLDEGGLYDLPETFSTANYLTLYLRIKEGWAEKVQQSLVLFGGMGIGKRRSTGKGGFSVLDFAPFDKFDSWTGANAFISLSHFVPAADDPVIGCYKTLVKYPKLDREFATGPNLFKYPLILLVPGSVFHTGQSPKPFYGKALQNIAPGNAKAVQGCFAFAAPARVAMN